MKKLKNLLTYWIFFQFQKTSYITYVLLYKKEIYKKQKLFIKTGYTTRVIGIPIQSDRFILDMTTIQNTYNVFHVNLICLVLSTGRHQRMRAWLSSFSAGSMIIQWVT